MTAALEPRPALARDAARRTRTVSPRVGASFANAWTPRCDSSSSPVALLDLELVPEVERRGGTVEAGPDIRGGRRRADVDLHATASGSLSPCPVMTQTTLAPCGGSARSAARPAAEDGSQNRPSSLARSRHASRIAVVARSRRRAAARVGQGALAPQLHARARRSGSPMPRFPHGSLPRAATKRGSDPASSRSRARTRRGCRRRRTGARARRADRRAPRRSRTRRSSAPRGGAG